MKQVLITGANRGVGLELTRQLLAQGDRVIATCRQPAEAQTLQEWADQFGDQLLVLALDVTDDTSVQEARRETGSVVDRLDMLINNAGILIKDETVSNFDSEVMQRTLDVNAVGVMRVATQFVDLLRQGREAKLINISSQLGSLQKMRRGWGQYSYNSSKAALNMVTRMLAFDLEEDGIAVLAVHPGWVQTDMGGAHAAVTAQDSAAGILRLADNLTLANTGEFRSYSGEEHMW
jgi:NAD(P)-dependent dehydrogenase (short-subunit alcohol dehydrogenase family)